jgi:hypothetical protein
MAALTDSGKVAMVLSVTVYSLKVKMAGLCNGLSGKDKRK